MWSCGSCWLTSNSRLKRSTATLVLAPRRGGGSSARRCAARHVERFVDAAHAAVGDDAPHLVALTAGAGRCAGPGRRRRPGPAWRCRAAAPSTGQKPASSGRAARRSGRPSSVAALGRSPHAALRALSRSGRPGRIVEDAIAARALLELVAAHQLLEQHRRQAHVAGAAGAVGASAAMPVPCACGSARSDGRASAAASPTQRRRASPCFRVAASRASAERVE